MKRQKATDIIEKIKDRKKKDEYIKVSFYLSRDAYQKFKKICGDVSVSSVINEWIKEQV